MINADTKEKMNKIKQNLLSLEGYLDAVKTIGNPAFPESINQAIENVIFKVSFISEQFNEVFDNV
jgi:hypothetical protein